MFTVNFPNRYENPDILSSNRAELRTCPPFAQILIECGGVPEHVAHVCDAADGPTMRAHLSSGGGPALFPIKSARAAGWVSILGQLPGMPAPPMGAQFAVIKLTP